MFWTSIPIVSLFWGAIGAGTMVASLAKWLGDRWLGKLLEKEKAEYARQLEDLRAAFSQELARYRAELDRSTFVTRTHFETEFAAVKEVSQSLSIVKLAVRELYPIEFKPENPEPRHIVELENASERFKEKLEEWAVFLEPKLYDEFDRCLAGAQALSQEERSLDDKRRSGSQQYFWNSYRKACQMVRDRIQSLAVIPRT
jgi:hypothetical protein